MFIPPRPGRHPISVRRLLLALMMAAVLITTAIFSNSMSVVPTANAVSTTIVISQIYGGGGNAGSTYTHDFIELFNRGASPVSLNGWSVQYASATGTTWQVTNLTNVTLQPGQYYLVQEAMGAGGTTALPTPDATGAIAMSATAGKVALVNTTTALTGACPSGATIVDFIGFGATANCSETAPAPAPSNTTADIRGANGCTETDNNSTDFTAIAPNPRNTATPVSTCGGGGGPTISINNVTQNEGHSGPTTFTFTVSLSAPAGPGGVTYNIATADNTATDADNDYEPISLTGENIPEGSTSKMYNVTVNGDPNVEPTETFFVNVTSVTGATPTSVQGTGTITNDDGVAGPLRIHDIQAASHLSPQAGMAVTNVPGIVTAKRTAAADGSKGFYIQDPAPDANDATSEGIFVFTTNATILASVTVGDSVLVSGNISEFRPGGAASANLTVTEIISPTVIVSSGGNPLPAAVVVGTGGRIPPMEVIEDDSAGDVETSNVFDPASDGIDFYESLEHMRVVVNNAVVVGPTTTFGSGFPNKEIYVIGDNGANASVRTNRGGIVIRPNDFNPERIVVTNLFVTLGDLNVADTFTDPIEGIYDYNFGKFLLHATSPLTTASGGLTQEVATIQGAGQLTIATFNVENLDPNDGPGKFGQLANLIVDNLRSPDLITIEEIQDNNGATNDAIVDASVTFNMLISAISDAGGPTYLFRQINPVDDQDGGEPGGNIRVGFLFRTDRGLSFVDRGSATSTSSTTVNNNGGMPELSDSPGRIDPTNPAFNDSRKPLAGEFLFNGRKLFVIGNHFNSKGGDDPTYGRRQPPVLNSEAQRIQQAQIVNNFVDSILAVDVNANIVVLGDINDFQFSTPMNVLKGGVLNTLIDTLPVSERYSYDFQGNSQTLDHILVSSNLFRTIFRLDVVHANSEFAVQASDHDPQIAYFTFIRRNQTASFDNDGKTDISVWDPDTGEWIIRNSSDGSITTQQWGLGSLGDVIVPGDYDKDGKTDLAVWRGPTGVWYVLRSSDGAIQQQHWGTQNLGDIPVPGDYDGDTQTDYAVFRPNESVWYILQSSSGEQRTYQWGVSTDKPVPGDYDGDGRTDIAVWRPATGVWYVLRSFDGGVTGQQWGGVASDVAVPADYDNDGKTDLAVWRASTGIWYILNSSNGSVSGPQWGNQSFNDVAVPADYDGDGKADVAVWRPATGTWYIINSSNGSTSEITLGTADDKPVPSAYIRP